MNPLYATVEWEARSEGSAVVAAHDPTEPPAPSAAVKQPLSALYPSGEPPTRKRYPLWATVGWPVNATGSAVVGDQEPRDPAVTRSRFSSFCAATVRPSLLPRRKSAVVVTVRVCWAPAQPAPATTPTHTPSSAQIFIGTSPVRSAPTRPER